MVATVAFCVEYVRLPMAVEQLGTLAVEAVEGGAHSSVCVPLLL